MNVERIHFGRLDEDIITVEHWSSKPQLSPTPFDPVETESFDQGMDEVSISGHASDQRPGKTGALSTSISVNGIVSMFGQIDRNHSPGAR